MEHPLAPFGVARRGQWPAPGGNETGIERIDIGFVKNHPSPPRLTQFGRLRDQVEKIWANAEAGETCVLSPMDQLQAQHPIKLDGAAHIFGGECYSTDILDHDGPLT